MAVAVIDEALVLVRRLASSRSGAPSSAAEGGPAAEQEQESDAAV